MTSFSLILCRLKNSIKHGNNFVRIPKSRYSKEVLFALYKAGYLKSFCVSGFQRKDYFVYLSPVGVSRKILSLRSVSKFSHRVFLNFKQISRKYKTSDFLIVSTSRGILLNEEIFFYGIGGEILADSL